MKPQAKKVFTVFIMALFCVSVQGCDKLNTLKEYIFSSDKKESKKETPAASKGSEKKEKVSAPAAAAPKKEGPMKDNVLVRVGSWTITIDEFKERLKALQQMVPEYKPGDVEQDKKILQELINQQLLVTEAEKQGLGNSKEVKDALDEFRRTLLVQELARKTIEKVSVSEDEIQQFYDMNKSDFTEPAAWKIREIVVGSEEEAKQILVELYQGADFAETAKAKSKGDTASSGGDLGEISTFQFPKQGNVVTSLEVGDISGVFKGPQGYYIVKLEDKKGGQQKELDEIKDDIRSGLLMLKQQQEVMTYLKKLEADTKIEINEKLLERSKL